MKLRGGRWKNFVTSDEAMLCLGGSYERRKVCYMRKGETVSDKLKFVKRDRTPLRVIQFCPTYC
ncbi:hypothetical protein DPMN_165071 [Dreissena polymorpha]|uniref:Uncharacterized protein n=1 Tax=Dreissena polymorpha TaxID=45954 RepID=A0A9D4EW82_DREPO|nr:hypothetical protein DPMN_165071 [Dreissena polymorpha]